MFDRAPDRLVIVAAGRAELEQQLTKAVEEIRDIAMTERRRGILVTHETPGRFSVALSDEVPFGLTRQRVAW